jgi:hypothetical protein
MTSPKSNFKKADVRRALNAVQQEGLEVETLEIGPDGTIKVVFGSEKPKVKNDWDEHAKT